MKKLLVVVLCLAASVAFSQSDPGHGATQVWTDAQALTEPAPTVVTEGLSINNAHSYRVTVCADSGQTLSGAGTLTAYYWDNTAGLWIRNPALDIAVSTASVRCLASTDFKVSVPAGRVFYAATGVTVSSGTVTVYVKAWMLRGDRK